MPLLLALGLGWSAPSLAATLVVDGTTYKSISSAIAAASNGDTIEVAAGTWYDCVDFGGKSLTLVGTSGSASTLLDGAGVCEVALSIDSGEVGATVRGFTVSNNGGQGILLDATGVSLEDVAIDTVGSGSDTTATGVYVRGGDLTWTTGSLASATGYSCQGLGVAAGASASVEDVDVVDTSTGFCVDAGGDLALVGVTFTDGAYGIVLAPGATASTEASEFTGSSILSAIFSGDGASYSSTDDEFSLGRTAIYTEGDGTLTVTGSSFLRHTGTAVTLSSRTVALFESASFDDNSGSEAGAILSYGTDLTTSHCVFAGNTSADVGGAINTGSLVDVGSTFQANEARRGQAIYAGYDLSLDGTTITDHDGGAVFWSPSSIGTRTFSAKNCVVSDQTGTAYAAFYAEDSSGRTLVVDGCTFSGNETGAIATHANTTIIGSVFENNERGALSVGLGTVTISGSRFTGNDRSGNAGGAVFASTSGGAMTVSDSWFEDNVAILDGGAIYFEPAGTVSSAELVVERSVFVGNSSSRYGGALYAMNQSVSGSYFCENTSESGGVSFANRATWTNNIAAANVGTYGGVLMWMDSATLTNNTFVGNEAVEGAAGWATYANGTALNNVFAYSRDGSALYADRPATTSFAPTYNAWWDNTPSHGAGSFTIPATGFGNIEADPQLAGWTDDGDCWNDGFAPLAGSPLIDAGSPSLLDTDGSVSDIGALGGPSAAWVDGDGDGWIAEFDCDDGDAALHAGLTEVCNGRDDDCDGTVDGPDATGATTWYRDADGDGHGDPARGTQACDAPDGYVDTADDCDDSDPDVAIPTTEVPYDDVDQDCDGADLTDVDEDGYDAYAAGGDDCDDEDADAHPGASETPYDGADQDCDGADLTDVDGDGRDALSAGGSDCDDDDDTVHPGATDVPGDGVDQDCDGADETGGPGDDGEGKDGGCGGCASSSGVGSGWALLLALGALARRRRTLLLSFATVAACKPGGDDCEPQAWYGDADGDGYGAGDPIAEACEAPAGAVGEAGDCDDADGSAHPGAEEVCGGGDEDCDGFTNDEDDVPGAPVWHEDADRDGFGAVEGTRRCEPLTGWLSEGADCDDRDPDVNPDGAERCDAEGADEDCDGLVDDADSSAEGKTAWYVDADADGWGAPGASAEACDPPAGYGASSDDCDDSDGGVNPDAEEVCENGVDDDCDGAAGGCGIADAVALATDAAVTVIGDAPSDGIGFHEGATRAGDIDGDGHEDLVATSSGAESVYVWYGPVSGELPAGSADVIVKDADRSLFGYAMLGGHDLDGAGGDDVVVMRLDPSTSDSYAYVLTSWTGTSIDASDAATRITNLSSASSFHDFAGGDVDGDGQADLLIADYDGDADGFAHVFRGPLPADDLLTRDADLTASGYGGAWRVAAADLDGDGLDEGIADALATYATGGGAVYVFAADLSGSIDLETDSDVVVSGIADTSFGSDVAAGDLDGDGRADLAIGASRDDTRAPNAGAVYVFASPLASSLAAADATASVYDEEEADLFAEALAVVPDATGDGIDDLLVGAPYANGPPIDSGIVSLFAGPVEGTLTPADAASRIAGADSGHAGASVAAAGDVTGDGIPDLLVGAPYYSSYAGALYVVAGGGL